MESLGSLYFIHTHTSQYTRIFFAFFNFPIISPSFTLFYAFTTWSYGDDNNNYLTKYRMKKLYKLIENCICFKYDSKRVVTISDIVPPEDDQCRSKYVMGF
jgi:hypothetical protein